MSRFETLRRFTLSYNLVKSTKKTDSNIIYCIVTITVEVKTTFLKYESCISRSIPLPVLPTGCINNFYLDYLLAVYVSEQGYEDDIHS